MSTRVLSTLTAVFLAVTGASMAGCDPGILPSDGDPMQAISLEGQSGKDSLRADGNSNPGILPINSTPHGKTYGEWAAAYWQWVLSIPEDRNPLLTSGDFCGEGQSGPVWFYAGNFGWDEEKFCTMPKGKTLFMPVYPWVFGAGVFDCGVTNPGVPCDVEALRAAAAAAVLAWEVMEVSIDGVPVESIDDYRALSPEPFSITFPENAIFGIPPGAHFPHVTDGYWLMLTPLPPGEHLLRVRVLAPAVEIDFEVITHLTVE